MKLKINKYHNSNTFDDKNYMEYIYDTENIYANKQPNNRMIDNKTLKLAKKYIKDKELIKKCEQTKDSMDGDDPDDHRSLQKQVSAKTGYFNKKYYDANSAVIHYCDGESKTFKQKQEF